MTTVLKIKLLSEDKKADIEAAIAAYKAGAGAALLTDQRGMAFDAYVDPGDKDTVFSVALAHAGDDVPAAKVADLQHILVVEDKLADAQTALDAALAAVVHHKRTDGDADTNAGDITVGGAMFQATDVGTRKVKIGGSLRDITAFVSGTRVTYSGAAITGTGLTVELLGAECLQDLQMKVLREADGDPKFHILAACEGQLA